MNASLRPPTLSNMPFEISVTAEFAAAHALRLYDGSLEPLHGHNWRVRVTVRSQELDAIGVVMDFHELERRLGQIIAPLQNRTLNDVAPFAAGLNPSAENVALHVGRSLPLEAGIGLVCVECWETSTCRAAYYPPETAGGAADLR